LRCVIRARVMVKIVTTNNSRLRLTVVDRLKVRLSTVTLYEGKPIVDRLRGSKPIVNWGK